MTAPKRLGPIKLAAGVAPGQVVIFLCIISIASILNQFMGLMQPLVLVQQLHVPHDRQGLLSGSLATVQQLGTLVFIGTAGALSDVIGRRTLLMLTLFGFAFCLFSFPYIAAVWGLFAVRLLWGVAFTGWTAGGAVLTMDYPDNVSRGKFVSLVLISYTATGFVFMKLVSSRLVSSLKTMGFAADNATRYAFWIMALLALAGGLCTLFFLKRYQPRSNGATKPEKAPARGQVLRNLGAVLTHAKTNPRLALILLIGCIVRTDGVIIATFLALWLVNAGHLTNIDPIEATKTAGGLIALYQGAQFLTTPVVGFLLDRIDRVRLTIGSLAATTIGFCAFGLIPDAFGGWMVAAAIFIGVADAAQAVSSHALVAQEAPAELRGSTMGVFAFLGTVSLLIVNFAGGVLFDKIGFASPFVMEGVLHLVFFIAAILIVRSPRFRRLDIASLSPSFSGTGHG